MRIIEIDVKHAIHDSGLPEMGYSVNPYLGCFHGCLYCFAIDFTAIREARENWGEVVVVTRNFIDVLTKDIRNIQRKTVGVSTITDPYQPVEAKYRLTRKSLELLLSNGFRVTLQSKSPLVLRDIDLLMRYSNKADVGFTITHPDPGKAILLETQTPSPLMRAQALRMLSQSGIRTWIYFGPIIQGFNDGTKEIEGIAQIAADTGSRVIYDFYNPYTSSLKLLSSAGFHDVIGSRQWRERVKTEIERIFSLYGLDFNSQSEDYVAESKLINRTLEDFS